MGFILRGKDLYFHCGSSNFEFSTFVDSSFAPELTEWFIVNQPAYRHIENELGVDLNNTCGNSGEAVKVLLKYFPEAKAAMEGETMEKLWTKDRDGELLYCGENTSVYPDDEPYEWLLSVQPRLTGEGLEIIEEWDDEWLDIHESLDGVRKFVAKYGETKLQPVKAEAPTPTVEPSGKAEPAPFVTINLARISEPRHARLLQELMMGLNKDEYKLIHEE